MPRTIIIMPLKPLLSLLALSLGFLGVVVCGAGIAAVWSAGSRLSRANENVFDGIDESLVVVRNRVLGARRRVQESKITTEDVEQSLRNWTRRETSKRLESRLTVGKNAEQLALAFQQADQWLELSGVSIQSVQRALELGSSIGAPVDATLVDPMLEKLASLRGQLKRATETADGIRERAAEIAEGESVEERIDQAVQLALRLVATLGELDSHLRESAEILTETQAKAQHLKSKTHLCIVTAQIGAVLLIAWMAAGQACMGLLGWKKRQTHVERGSM